MAAVAKLRVAIAPMGSRGDHQPYVGLVKALQAAGIEVEMWVLGEENGAFMRSLGVGSVRSFAGLVSHDELLQQNPDMASAMASGKPGKFLKMVESVFGPLRADVTRWTCANMESFRPHVLLYHQFNIVLARDMHDRYGVGLCFAPLCPSVPTNDYPPHLLVGYHLPCCGLNMKLHRLLRQVMFKPQLAPDSAVQALRAEAGLRPLAFEDLWDVYYSREHMTIHGYSPLAAPRSADWPPTVHVAGYWLVPASQQLQSFPPSAELEAFLGAGPPPVYMGWGSMVAGSSEAMAALAVGAAQAAGVRCIVLGGWAKVGAGGLPSAALRAYAAQHVLFHPGSLAHEWLLPRCAAAVHHGGAGTTAASLRAGKPTVVTPVMVDQFFWAQRVNALGVGFGFKSPLLKLTPKKLGDAIRRCVESESVRGRADALGAMLREEDGGAAAAALVRELAERKAQEMDEIVE